MKVANIVYNDRQVDDSSSINLVKLLYSVLLALIAAGVIETVDSVTFSAHSLDATNEEDL